MLDPFKESRKKRARLRLIDIDASIDSTLFRLWHGFLDLWEDISVFFYRFKVSGPKRLGIELLSDLGTFGTAGLVLALWLALPAFEATETDWLTQEEYSVTFYDRYGNEIGRRGILQNDSVPIDEMPDALIKATLATEDRRFFSHFGIDFFGTARAMIENVRARTVVQGGSSLTQQLAKNLFLSSERTLMRKIKEAFLALWLETHLTKKEILKLYFDRAYMGAGTFGVAAAAEFYFGKNVRDISLAEAAMLSGLYKAPTKYAPHINLPAARARANEVLQNLVQAGFMTDGQILSARRNPAKTIARKKTDSPDYFLDWAFEEVKKLANKKDRVLFAHTTIDLSLQTMSDRTVKQMLRTEGKARRVSEAALVVMEPDGAVRSMVGGRDYGESQFNRATDAKRQPGSSFKPFVYLTALENGYRPNSIVRDAPITIGNWSPKNYTRSYAGPVSLTRALAKSINTIPVRLAQAMGRGKIVEVTQRLGVRSKLPITRSLPLGSAEISVLEMTGAYSVFASGGKAALPYGITRLRSSEGVVLFDRQTLVDPNPQIVAEKKIRQLNGMMHSVVEAGTGGRARVEGVPVAGKTGTTSSYRDAWFVGYSGNYISAVWYGNDNYRPTARVTGGSLPAITWQQIMRFAHSNTEIKPLPGIRGFGRLSAKNRLAKAKANINKNAPVRARTLSRESVAVLRRIERSMRDARRALMVSSDEPVSRNTSGDRNKAQLIAKDPATQTR